ncbi:hypothetical protein G4228_015262 [Cervus hanglu yarkandensis]|nr:hypothetical protein G4228_015262 [Cervus hanglu yarkandensis]
MADGPRCKRRKQANPRRNNGDFSLNSQLAIGRKLPSEDVSIQKSCCDLTAVCSTEEGPAGRAVEELTGKRKPTVSVSL